MHADAFDRYHEADSPLHHLDPRVKVLVTVAFILSNVLLPDGAWLAFGLSWLFVLSLNLLAQLGPGFTFRRSFVALPFALAAITAVFSIPGTALGEWHLGSSDAHPDRCRCAALCQHRYPLVAVCTDCHLAGGSYPFP